MFFYKKKKLLEMETKIDSLLEIIQKQEKQIGVFTQKITELTNQQEQIKNQLEEKIDETVNGCLSNKLDECIKNYSMLLQQINNAKEKIEECTIENSEKFINVLNFDKLELEKCIIENLKQVQKKYIDENKKLVDIIINQNKKFVKDSNQKQSWITDEFGELKHIVETTVDTDTQKVLESNELIKNILIDSFTKNNVEVKQDMKSLDDEIRLILLNSVMNQLS